MDMDGLKLTVLISDPMRKKTRSDAGARELRVTGVVKSVTKAELEKLFSPVGNLPTVFFCLADEPCWKARLLERDQIGSSNGKQPDGFR